AEDKGIGRAQAGLQRLALGGRERPHIDRRSHANKYQAFPPILAGTALDSCDGGAGPPAAGVTMPPSAPRHKRTASVAKRAVRNRFGIRAPPTLAKYCENPFPAGVTQPHRRPADRYRPMAPYRWAEAGSFWIR